MWIFKICCTHIEIQNSKSALIDSEPIIYSDSDVTNLGGLDKCVKDALSKNKIPNNNVFLKMFVCNNRYLMIGYMYNSKAYGCIILYGYENATIRYNIKNNVITRIS